MGHTHTVTDTDARFVIDVASRAINRVAGKKSGLMQFDHNSERLTFEMPRYVEEHDMTECNLVEVHYLNIDQSTKKEHTGLYEVDDLAVDSEDESKIVFSWLVKRGATQHYGKLNFMVSFACTADGVIEYAWHTDIFADTPVRKSINASGAFETEYVEIIERWKASVMAHFTGELDKWKTATAVAVREEAFEDIAIERKRIDLLFHYVTPQMFGAVGDGVTDDTRALQECFDAASESGKPCKIPRGTYCFKSLTIKSNISIEGVDKVLACLKHTSTGDAITVKPDGINNWMEFLRVNLRNFTIEGNADTESGIRISECIHSSFENLYIKNGKVGVWVDGSSSINENKNSVFNNEFKGISVVGCSQIGFKIDGIISDTHFENLYAEQCPICADMTSASTHNVSFTDGSFIICEKGFYIHGLFNNVRIETFNIEQYSSHGIHIVGDGVNHCKNYMIANCLFYGNQANALCVEATKLSNSIIWNNNSLGSVDKHIKLASGCLGVMLMNNNKNNSAEEGFVSDIPATCFAVNYIYDKQDAFAITAPLKLNKAIVNNVTLVDSSGGHSEVKLFDAYSIAVKKGGYHTYILPALTSDERLNLAAPRNGSCVFDVTLGKPVWRAGDAYWVDATGARIY